MLSLPSASPEDLSSAPKSLPAKRGILARVSHLVWRLANWLVSISWLRTVVALLIFALVSSLAVQVVVHQLPYSSGDFRNVIPFILDGAEIRLSPLFNTWSAIELASILWILFWILYFVRRIGRLYANWLASMSWLKFFLFFLISVLAFELALLSIVSFFALKSGMGLAILFQGRFMSEGMALVGVVQIFPVLWIFLSVMLKIGYRGRVQPEPRVESVVKAAEKADLERQVTEARLSTLQSQLEPHFLFNTLSSIDYLIHTDPPKAGNILRSFIAFLRASFPSIQSSKVCPLRPLGAEIDLVEAYLQIQKARMEDRLRYSIEIPQTLRSALCPPFMLQTLAENAIKHGLEPKREGGSLHIAAFVENEHLQITVRDSGIGLGAVSEASSGTGLTNLRERLRLLFGQDADFSLRSEPESGTVALLHLPYSTQPSENSFPTDTPT